MNEFWVNFWANILADALVAIVAYYAFTRPGERKAKQAQLEQALGLLRLELQTNRARAEKYLQALEQAMDGQPPDLQELFPLRFTRGAWNALRESGFLPQLYNAKLVYYLLRMNEAALVANKSLRKWHLSYLKSKKTDRRLLAEAARQDCSHFLGVLLKALAILEQMALPPIAAGELIEEPGEGNIGATEI